ncbi:MAG: hypothetical protein IKU99_04990, partial [Clostridia bacterium]|nr:hypothetical protein [Clostridia bacterium]
MSFLLETTVNEPWASLLETLLSWCLGTGLKIIISLLILIISFRVINVISRRLEKRAKNDDRHDKTITKVLTYIGKVGAKAIIVICIVGYLGID